MIVSGMRKQESNTKLNQNSNEKTAGMNWIYQIDLADMGKTICMLITDPPGMRHKEQWEIWIATDSLDSEVLAQQ